jgi:hypothetical protein
MMITMIFTLMKMANVTTLNWWWVIIALLVDLKDEIGFWLNPYFDPRDADKPLCCNSNEGAKIDA